MDEMDIDTLPEYRYGSARKGKLITVIFPDHDRISSAQAAALDEERKRIELTFQKLGYEAHIWSSDPRKLKKKTFLDELDKVAHELPDSESMVMVVVCPQYLGKLRMTSGESFEMENIYLKFDAKSCPGLKCKPKFFVFCTHSYQDQSTVKRQDVHPSGKMRTQTPFSLPMFVPVEADILVIYSNEEGTASNQVFMNTLIQVFGEDFDKENGHKDILELTVDVSGRFLEQKGPDIPHPVVMSTLRSQYYFKT